MAMGDPFGTTAQLAQQGFGAFGQALTQLAEIKRQEQMKQKEMQLGLLEKLYPYAQSSSLIYTDPATGETKIVKYGGGNEALGGAFNNILSQMFGVPMGQGMTGQQPMVQSQQLQMPFNPIDTRISGVGMQPGGILSTQPQGFQQPTQQKPQALPPGFMVNTTGGKTKLIRLSSSEKLFELRKEDAVINAERVVKGLDSPMLTGYGMQGAAMVRAEIGRKHPEFNLGQKQLEWTAAQEATKHMNSNQMIQLRGALNSVKLDLTPMRQLNKEFQRVGFTPYNKVILSGRMHGVDWFDDMGNRHTAQIPDYSINTSGLDKNQVRAATQFVSQLNLMKDNMAVAFMRGGVPTDQAFKLADQILNPAYGQQQYEAALDQVETNVNLRDQAFAEIQPMLPGGGTSSYIQPNQAQSVLSAAGMGGQQSQIQPGTIEDGYRFKGGDPGDQKNWEKI